MNVLLLLLNSSRPLTRAEIFQGVEGYGDDANQSEQRKFEHDKNNMRQSVALVVTKDPDTGIEAYSIDKRKTFMPDLSLSNEERILMALASRAWGDEFTRQAANVGVIYAGVTEQDLSELNLSFGSNEKHVSILMSAVIERKVIQFDYYSRNSDETATRTIEPWRVALHEDRWYVYGFDQVRREPRLFKLGRIRGLVRVLSEAVTENVPDDIDIKAIFDEFQQTESEPTVARLRVPIRDCANLRLQCNKVLNEGEFDVLEIVYTDGYRLAHQIALVADRVQVLEPARLRDDVNVIIQAAEEENS